MQLITGHVWFQSSTFNGILVSNTFCNKLCIIVFCTEKNVPMISEVVFVALKVADVSRSRYSLSSFQSEG